MGGVTLSRWTMSYFAFALVFFIVAQGLMASGYGFPATTIAAPQTLILVHVVVIGWLSFMMCGALFQFVPVLVAKPLYSNTLSLVALVGLLAGLIALLLGFLQLAGYVALDIHILPWAGILLGFGFGIVLWNLGVTLWCARPLSLPARFVAIGLCCNALTVTFGILFALVLGGLTEQSRLLDFTALGLPLHIIAGLGGWLTFTAMGVSYRLLAMFMLAPELDGATTRGAFYLGVAALTVAILGGAVAICSGIGLIGFLLAGGLLGLGALLLYGRDVLHLYRARKRRVIELNSRMAGFALINLTAAMAFTVVLVATGTLERYVGALVFFIAFAWLSGLGLAMLYKIVAFLTWLECYGPVLGKTPTPRVQDLVVEPRATKWFVLYFAAVWLATVCLLADLPLTFRFAAGAMTIASFGIIAQLVRTRRLADVKAPLRLPKGTQQPRLLLVTTQHS
jgi:hypothetical protein